MSNVPVGMRDADRLTHAYETILGEIASVANGTARTPERAAQAILEMTGGYQCDIASLFTLFDSEGHDEMVVLRGIEFHSLCEHHLLPFYGQAHVAYLPGKDKIIGISKLARLVDAFSHRLQVQERMTGQIADALVEHGGAKGAAVITEARHLCMETRGVRKAGAVTVTSAMRGAMMDSAETRAEMLALARS